jgi:hypothetical protein
MYNFTQVERGNRQLVNTGYDGIRIAKESIGISRRFEKRLKQKNVTHLMFASDFENNALLVTPTTESNPNAIPVRQNASGMNMCSAALSKQVGAGRYIVNDVTEKGWILLKD